LKRQYKKKKEDTKVEDVEMLITPKKPVVEKISLV